MSQDELPTYASAANTSQVTEAASTGYPAIDAARDAAQKLAARAQTVEHHKADTARVSQAVNTIISAVLSSLASVSPKRKLSNEAISIVERLGGIVRDIEVLLDEIRDMSVTRRNLNRSWTEHNISEKEKKLERVSSDLNIIKGRSGVIEGVPLQPEPETTTEQKKHQFATALGGEVWL